MGSDSPRSTEQANCKYGDQSSDPQRSAKQITANYGD